MKTASALPNRWIRMTFVADYGLFLPVDTFAKWRLLVRDLIVNHGYTFEGILNDSRYYIIDGDSPIFYLDFNRPRDEHLTKSMRTWAKEHDIELDDPWFATLVPHPNILTWRELISSEIERICTDVRLAGASIFSKDLFARTGLLFGHVAWEQAAMRPWEHSSKVRIYMHRSPRPESCYVYIDKR